MLRFLIGLALVTAALTLRGQNPPPQTPPTPTGNNTALPMWRCTLPGGSYSVALRAVVSVSTHEYLVDGTVRVTEVNIDTGSVLRSITSNRTRPMHRSASTRARSKAQQLLTEAAGRSGRSVEEVIRITDNHSRALSMRLTEKSQINTIFASAEEAFRLNRNTTLKVE